MALIDLFIGMLNPSEWGPLTKIMLLLIFVSIGFYKVLKEAFRMDGGFG